MRLADMQIAALTLQSGFQGPDAITAIAVCLAESNGNTEAYNPESQAGTASGQGSVGLWQIYKSAHPELATLDLTDPIVNGQAAFAVYRGAGGTFRPWSTFKNGLYLRYVQQAATAVGQLMNQASTGGDAPPADTNFRPAIILPDGSGKGTSLPSWIYVAGLFLGLWVFTDFLE